MFLSDFYFEPSMFVDSLKYMGIGMVGIFAVMLVIILSVYLLNYLSNKFGNSTKKLTKSNKIIIVVLIIALFGVSLVVYLTKDRYYECSEYLTISTENGEIVVTDELDNYDYYKFILNDDNTFVMTYKLSEKGSDEVELKGNYQYNEDKSVLTLSYEDENIGTEIYEVKTNEYTFKTELHLLSLNKKVFVLN